MAQVNPLTREVLIKLVYYGPGLGGKTSSLQCIHASSPPETRGQIVSLATPVDRTLYFDFLPLRVPAVRGYHVRIQLFTVPGQVYFNATRKLVLTGCDGVVFVADSVRSRHDANLESLENLASNLEEQGRTLVDMPLVIQYNKRDLPDVLPIEEMDETINALGAPSFPTSATTGQGVLEALDVLVQTVLEDLMRKKAFGDDVSPIAPPRFGRTDAGIAERVGVMSEDIWRDSNQPPPEPEGRFGSDPPTNGRRPRTLPAPHRAPTAMAAFGVETLNALSNIPRRLSLPVQPVSNGAASSPHSIPTSRPPEPESEADEIHSSRVPPPPKELGVSPPRAGNAIWESGAKDDSVSQPEAAVAAPKPAVAPPRPAVSERKPESPLAMPVPSTPRPSTAAGGFSWVSLFRAGQSEATQLEADLHAGDLESAMLRCGRLAQEILFEFAEEAGVEEKSGLPMLAAIVGVEVRRWMAFERGIRQVHDRKPEAQEVLRAYAFILELAARADYALER